MKKYLFFKNSAFPRIPCPDSPLPFGIFPRISTGTVTPLPQPPLRLQKTPLSPAKTAQRLLAPPEPPGCSEKPSRFHAPKFFQNLPVQTRTLNPLLRLRFFQSLSITARTLKPKHTSEVFLRGVNRQRDIHGFAKIGARQSLRRELSLRGPSV